MPLSRRILFAFGFVSVPLASGGLPLVRPSRPNGQ